MALLRTTFGPSKPPYRLYQALFAHEQDVKTKSDIFICKARAVLSQLPNGTLTEGTQIDLIYGLLHRRVGEKVPCDKVSSFEELMNRARLAEETFEAPVNRPEGNRPLTTKDELVRCTYCQSPGHEQEECRKRKNYEKRLNGNIPDAQPSSITCYGCGAPGVTRSNCSKCSKGDRNGPPRSSDAAAESLCSSTH